MIIEDNVIVDNMGLGIRCVNGDSFRGPQFLYNLIARNRDGGIYCINPSASIEYNYIVDNGAIGVESRNLKSFQHNGIFNNESLQYMFLGSADQVAANNDWGISDSNAIDALIYDQFDDSNFGTVQYAPFLRIDDSNPTVLGLAPADGDTDVDLDVVILVVFSEIMRASTLNNDTVTLFEGEDKVPGKINYSGGVLVEFDPDGLLKGDTVYTLTLSSDIHEKTYLKNSIDTHMTSFVTKSN